MSGCEPGCERPEGHLARFPCGGKLHTPGDPCQFCGKATPLTGGPCPDCWISLEGMAMADIKGLFARGGLGLDHGEGP